MYVKNAKIMGLIFEQVFFRNPELNLSHSMPVGRHRSEASSGIIFLGSLRQEMPLWDFPFFFHFSRSFPGGILSAAILLHPFDGYYLLDLTCKKW
jgi:hypothetical protein